MSDVAAPRELIAGRYEILRPLGRGGMGEVLLARQLNLDRLVVIKRIAGARSERELEALSVEARVAARLHHPNIVNILDVIERDGDPVVVMELVVGVSLRELLERAPEGLPVEVALAIASDLLRALGYAHHVGVVHRDVHPRNVMVTFAGTSKLIDFGISQWLGRGRETSISGTRGYMAPEQQRGEAVDGRADQYAAGVTLREMFGNKIASPRLAAIIDRACAEDVAARFATCGEVLLALEDFLAEGGIAATATHVERWTCERFADQRVGLERDVEQPLSQRSRRPTAQTVVEPGSGERRPRPFGAPSTELLEQYRDLVTRYYAFTLPDTSALVVIARAIVEADPTWAHAYALLLLLEGRSTPAALATIETGLARADAARDPAGMKLLEAAAKLARGETEAAYELLVAASDADDTDVLAGSSVVLAAVALHRADEATALTRRLHRAHPELAFGADLADACRRSGRASAAETVVRTWVAAVGASLAARVELVRIEATAGRMAEAVANANEAMSLHGDRDDALPQLFEAMIASDQIALAEQIADRMLSGSSLMRARGRYRSAVTAVFEGRFAAAYDSARRAIDEHRVFGFQSELVQCLELARSLAALLGDSGAVRRFTIELADTFDILVGDTATAAATRYELALLTRPPPSIDDHLVGLDDGPGRDVARRRMLRAAAVADCGSPHKAVAAGFSAFEENTASLVALGLCAGRLCEFELARHSLERATHLWSSIISTQNSPYHAILARFHLAGVLVELGDRAGARRLYDSFLRAWTNADRPIPEVTATRELLPHI